MSNNVAKFKAGFSTANKFPINVNGRFLNSH